MDFLLIPGGKDEVAAGAGAVVVAVGFGAVVVTVGFGIIVVVGTGAGVEGRVVVVELLVVTGALLAGTWAVGDDVAAVLGVVAPVVGAEDGRGDDVGAGAGGVNVASDDAALPFALLVAPPAAWPLGITGPPAGVVTTPSTSTDTTVVPMAAVGGSPPAAGRPSPAGPDAVAD